MTDKTPAMPELPEGATLEDFLIPLRHAQQAVPMTDGAKRELISDFFSDDWAQERAMNLLHDYDQHHGITAQGAQEGV